MVFLVCPLAYFTKETDLPFPIKGAVCFENQAQFHPLLFIKEIYSLYRQNIASFLMLAQKIKTGNVGNGIMGCKYNVLCPYRRFFGLYFMSFYGKYLRLFINLQFFCNCGEIFSGLSGNGPLVGTGLHTP